MTAELRLGRWQDVLPGTYDVDRAVVITDPPFGLLATAEGRRKADRLGKGYADALPWARHVEEVLELLPARRHVIRGSSEALLRRDYPQPRRMCVELAAFRLRTRHLPGVVPHLWQGWVIYGRIRVGRHARAPRGDALTLNPYARSPLRAGFAPGAVMHQGITPAHAAEWIVDLWADPGDVVIDPFAGIGTIGIAAAALGFDYLGAELDPTFVAEGRMMLEYGMPRLAL